ncbi:ATP-binding cassette domain-containing protein [Bradyrhizobium iriomotense]|uniref:ATP-binding cassette domain-containing protein n=1 Tax=Bradyrhizobium iriomotense TaxID=441950 RepID=UPI001B8A4B13|nr:ATP-binding cassette domain-containing protein [Bradyrhizobium iriomotense]MBR0785128.1 ATP-binding cassette domain-containing protein [Bradyrhizobium iriomotense]
MIDRHHRDIAHQHEQSGPAIEAAAVRHTFGSGDTARQVLVDFNIEVAQGEMVLLMGPSGCGKTTVLTLVGALRSLQSGFIRTLGKDLREADERAMIEVRRRIGFIYQAHNLHQSLTVRENIGMALEVHRPKAFANEADLIDAALDDVGMLGWADALPATLSGGQKQRVAIARAVVASPPLILADEPTAALDKANGRQVVDLLHDLAKRRGSAILMVTHDSRILDAADRIVEMEDGRIVNVETRQRPSTKSFNQSTVKDRRDQQACEPQQQK